MRRLSKGQVTTVRALGWAFFGVLVAVQVLLDLLPLPTRTVLTLNDVATYLTPMLLAAVAATVLAVRSDRIERRFWGHISGATALLLVSETYWTIYAEIVDPLGPRLPSAFELFQLAAAVLFFAVIVAMTTFGTAPVVSRVRLVLDVVGGMIVTTAAVYWFWTLPTFLPIARAGWRVAAIAAIYPIVGTAMLMCAGAVVLSSRTHRWRSWELLIVAALVLYGIGLFTFTTWYSQLLSSSDTQGTVWFSVVLGFGFYLLFMAVVYRATSYGPDARLAPWPIPKVGPSWLPLTYPIVLAAALPVLGWAALQVGDTPQGAWIVASAFALAAVLIARSWLAGMERSYHRAASVMDPVSGAYNHRYLHEHLAADIAETGASGPPLAVVVFDVDDFRSINVVHGHEAGDRVLGMIVEILLSEAGRDATVYRLGGDEFAVVSPQTDARDALEFAQRARARVARDIALPRTVVELSAGIALYPEHGIDGEQLIARAMAAQQLAAAADGIGVVVYTDSDLGAADPVERLARAGQRTHQATMLALAAAVDARDPDTAHHSENVAELAAALGVVLDLSPERIRSLELAAHMHDVGKIGVRDDVLAQHGELSAEARAIIEEHPALGERILAPAGLDEILPTVRHHHERWDGTGYPDCLVSYDIPLDARILAVCDAFEAMTSPRGARAAMTVPRALAEIEREAGAQFDPDIAHAFARMIGRLHGSALRDRLVAPSTAPVQ